MPDYVATFNCDCSLLTHTMRVTVADAEDGPRTMYVEVVLNPQASLWRRIKNAIWHVLGRATPYGAFDEFVIGPQDAPRLRFLLDRLEGGERPQDELH